MADLRLQRDRKRGLKYFSVHKNQNSDEFSVLGSRYLGSMKLNQSANSSMNLRSLVQEISDKDKEIYRLKMKLKEKAFAKQEPKTLPSTISSSQLKANTFNMEPPPSLYKQKMFTRKHPKVTTLDPITGLDLHAQSRKKLTNYAKMTLTSSVNG